MTTYRKFEDIPSKEYDVIYADPPWKVGSIILKKWESPLSDKYPTMTLEQIKQLPIWYISKDNCSLFLWTTHSFLEKAFEVIKAWGFKYYCCVTWDKGSGWCQHGFHKKTELCLFAYKGKMNVNQKGQFIPTLISEKKHKHSQKPEIMRELIEAHTPKSRIELFARQEANGWDNWGNEL